MRWAHALVALCACAALVNACCTDVDKMLLADFHAEGRVSRGVWHAWLLTTHSADLTVGEISMIAKILETVGMPFPKEERNGLGWINFWWRFLHAVVSERAAAVGGPRSQSAPRSASGHTVEFVEEAKMPPQVYTDVFATVLGKVMANIAEGRSKWLCLLARHALETGQSELLAHVVAFGRVHFAGGAHFSPDSDILYVDAMRSGNRVLLNDLAASDGFFATMPLRGVRAATMLSVLFEGLTPEEILELSVHTEGATIDRSNISSESANSMDCHSQGTEGDTALPRNVSQTHIRLDRDIDDDRTVVIVASRGSAARYNAPIVAESWDVQEAHRPIAAKIMAAGDAPLGALARMHVASAIIRHMSGMQLAAALEAMFDAVLEQNGWRPTMRFAQPLAAFFYVRLTMTRNTSWREGATSRQRTIVDMFGRELCDEDGVESLFGVLRYRGNGVLAACQRANVNVVEIVGAKNLIVLRSQPTLTEPFDSGVSEKALSSARQDRHSPGDLSIAGWVNTPGQCAFCNTDLLESPRNLSVLCSAADIGDETETSRRQRSQRDNARRKSSILRRSIGLTGGLGNAHDGLSETAHMLGDGFETGSDRRSASSKSSKGRTDTPRNHSPRGEHVPSSAKSYSIDGHKTPSDGESPRAGLFGSSKNSLAKIHPKAAIVDPLFTAHCVCGSQYHPECAANLPLGKCVRCSVQLAEDSKI